MPTLELVMDATGLQRGQQQAEAALKGVQAAAEQTQSSVAEVGGSLHLDAAGMQRGQQQAEQALKGVQLAAEKTQASVAAVGGSLHLDASGMQQGQQQAEAALKSVQASAEKTQASVANVGGSLRLDASGMQQGQQQAEQALKGVQLAAEKTQASVTQLGGSLSFDAAGMQRGQQQAETALKGVQDAATKTQASVAQLGGSLRLDATGIQRGQQQAEDALKGMQLAADKTRASVTAMGGSLRNTFQAVQGVSQVGQGLSQTVQAFGSLNLSMGAFSASRTLLEISRTTQDFKELAGATGGATSAWSVLGTVIRAHPLLTIATAIGAAASLMSLFSSNTKSAAQSFDDLAASMDKAKLDSRVANVLGISGDTRSAQMKRLEGAAGFAVDYRNLDLFGQLSQGGLNVERIQRIIGEGNRDRLLNDLARAGNKYALQFLETGAYSGEYLPGAGFRQREFRQPREEGGLITLTPEQLEDVIRRRYEGLFERGIGMPQGARAYGAGGLRFENLPIDPRTGAPRGAGEFGPPVPPDYEQQQDAADRAREQQREAADRVRESMEQAARYAGQIGAALGAGVYDVLAGIQSWRQALANIVQSFARQGLSDLGASLAGSLFKPTAQQTASTGVQGSAGMPGAGYSQ